MRGACYVTGVDGCRPYGVCVCSWAGSHLWVEGDTGGAVGVELEEALGRLEMRVHLHGRRHRHRCRAALLCA